jgi:pyrroline-5-carboxylate reductase
MGDRIALVGCGNMGQALLAGWRTQGRAADDIVVIEPDPERRTTARQRFGVTVLAAADELQPPLPPLFVLAVKPQVLGAVAAAYRFAASPERVFLSIAAGCPMALLAEWLGETVPIVRAMPNTPASIGQGITVACAAAMVTPPQRQACDAALRAVGEVLWIDDEALMDAVTAVSGSGPAYVFLFAECLGQAGIEAGLPPALAERLARATVSGAGALLARSAEPAAVLRAQVTSPGGTTAAALSVLQQDGSLKRLISEAVRRAALRAGELAAATAAGSR